MLKYTLLSAMALMIGCSHAEGWPRWRGSEGTGEWRGPVIATKLDSGTLPVVWKRAIGGGYSGVTTSGGRIYTMDRPLDEKGDKLNREAILCLDAATGKTIWSSEYDADYAGIGFDNGPRASVTVDGDRLYTLGAAGRVRCLNSKDGKLIWELDAVKELGSVVPGWGFAGSPVIEGNLVLLNLGATPTGSLVACDKMTGEVVWRAGEEVASYATPIVIDHPSGQRQVIHWGPKHVMGIHPVNGDVQWSFEYESQQDAAISDPIYHEGLLLVSGYFKGTRALRLGPAPTDVSLAWSDEQEKRGLMSGPLYRSGHTYSLFAPYGFTCISHATGEKVWEDEYKLTPKSQHAHATLIGLAGTDRAISLNNKGELVFLRLSADGYEEFWRAPVIGETLAHPGMLGDKFIARSDTELVCVKLPTE